MAKSSKKSTTSRHVTSRDSANVPRHRARSTGDDKIFQTRGHQVGHEATEVPSGTPTPRPTSTADKNFPATLPPEVTSGGHQQNMGLVDPEQKSIELAHDDTQPQGSSPQNITTSDLMEWEESTVGANETDGGFFPDNWDGIFHHADNSQSRRRRHFRPRRRPQKRVLLCGIDDIPHHVILSKLAKLNLGLERGPATLKASQGKTGIVLSHPDATKLLNANITDQLFGRRYRFSVESVSTTQLSLFIPYVPPNLTNNDLLEALPGVYRIRRLPKNKSKAFVQVVSDEARALLIRDGVSVRNQPIVFEVPKPHACRSCFSMDHRSCRQKHCSRCLSPNHLVSHCQSSRPTCPMCKSNDHDLSKCADYKDWQLQKQLEEESRLLSLIPSLEDSLQDPRPPQQVLTRRQQEIFEKGQSKSNGSYADIVSSRIAQRHKKRKKKERPKTSESPEEKKSDSPPDTKTHYTGPIGEVINRLDLSAMKHGLLVPFLKDAVPHLQLSYDQWVTEMSVLLQQKLNEAIQEEEKKVSRELSEQHATRLDSGQWTIHCECGMHFHMSKAEEHLQVCTLDPQPSPPTPSLPSTTPRKKRSRSTPTKEIQPDSAIIEIDEHSEDVEPLRTPSKKASLRRDEGTPESVKQMKIT